MRTRITIEEKWHQQSEAAKKRLNTFRMARSAKPS
jgi:hypothetical protein